jgi:hypothetical protein
MSTLPQDRATDGRRIGDAQTLLSRLGVTAGPFRRTVNDRYTTYVASSSLPPATLRQIERAGIDVISRDDGLLFSLPSTTTRWHALPIARFLRVPMLVAAIVFAVAAVVVVGRWPWT